MEENKHKEDEEVALLCEEINAGVSNSDIINCTFKSAASSVSMNRSGLLKSEEEEKLESAVYQQRKRG